MNLRDYLHFSRKTQKKFAEESLCSKGLIDAVANGRKKPSRKSAILISRATGGKVTVDEIMSLEGSKEEELEHKVG